MKTLLKNCRLIPELSNGCHLSLADLFMEDGKIIRIAEAGSLTEYDKAVDCGGKTLLPGLFDLHTHMNWAYHKGEIRLDDFKILIQSCQSAKLFLDNGITTIRDMGSPRRVAVAVRSAVQAGICVGPRILTGGLIISPVLRPSEADPYNFLRYASGCDEITRTVREEIGGGCDYVKLYTPILPEELEAAGVALLNKDSVQKKLMDVIANALTKKNIPLAVEEISVESCDLVVLPDENAQNLLDLPEELEDALIKALADFLREAK